MLTGGFLPLRIAYTFTDPTIAGAFVQSVARGIASAGVAPCAKHFPGHGDTHVDSHLALPTVNKTLTEMDATELVPFRGVIGSNSSSIASIMTAHIALPNLTLDDHPVLANEASVPASLSRRITHDLLRTKLEFRGVITTDCLEMEAIAGTVGVAPGAVQALRAGADIAIICHRFDRQCAAVEATWAAVQEGTLNKEELKASGRRIEEMKVKFVGRWEDVLGVDGAQLDEDQVTRLKKTNAGLSARTYGKSIALVSASTPSPLPLPEAGTPIVLYVPRSESINAAVDEEDADTATKPSTKPIRNTLGPTYAGLAEALERRVSKDRLRLVVYTPDEIDTTGLAPGGTVIFASQNAHTKAWQVDALKRLVEAHSTSTLRIVLISTCAPYDIPTLQTVVQGAGSTYTYACLATFEFTWPAFVSVVQVLFGEAQATGKIPVRLATV
jgi:beta-N-acetylhexosaminidase